SASGVSSSVRNGLAAGQQILDQQSLPTDFAAASAALRDLSAALASLPANGTFQSQWGGLYLQGVAGQPLQVFDLPGDLVLQAHTFEVSQIPAGATVLFNVRGPVAGLTNMSLQALAGLREPGPFHLPDATRLTLSGLPVAG